MFSLPTPPAWRAGVIRSASVLLVGACGGAAPVTAPPPPPPPPATPVVTTVTVSLPVSALFIDDTLQATATVRDQIGGLITGKAVAWTSSDPLRAPVDAQGRVIGLSAGSASITAMVDGKAGAAPLAVTGPATTGGVSGSALIGATGGSVAATLHGGGTLSLTIPAGALAAPALVTLDPLVATGRSQAAFQMSPAGLLLSHPATLVIRVSPGAKVRPSTVLVLDQDGFRVPVPGIVNVMTGTLTVSLAQLGTSPGVPAAGVSLRSAMSALVRSAPVAQGNLLSLTVDSLFFHAAAGLANLQQVGTPAAADLMQDVMEALIQVDRVAALGDARFGPILLGWRAEVCAEFQFAVNALQAFGVVSDYRGLERVSGAVIAWSQARIQVKAYHALVGFAATCADSGPDAETEVHAKITTLAPAIAADLNAFALTPSPRDSVFVADRLRPLLDLVGSLQGVGFGPSEQVLLGIVGTQLNRMRTTGYTECRFSRSQDLQGRLIRGLAVGATPGTASFGLTEVESDIQLCGMDLRWQVRDDVGATVANGQLGGGNTAGSIRPNGVATLDGDGIVAFSAGFANALMCPTPASSNNEQLEVLVRMGLQPATRVALLSPSNQNDYLGFSDLLIATTALRAATGLPVGTVGTVTLMVRRIGGLCSGLFANLQHTTLGSIDLTLDLPCPPAPSASAAKVSAGLMLVCKPTPPVTILTPFLADALVASPYFQTIQVIGGNGTFQWSIQSGALPPGLLLDPASGTVSGVPSQRGWFPFTARVVSGNQSQQSPLLIVSEPVLPPPSCPGLGNQTGDNRIVMNPDSVAALAGVAEISGNLFIFGGGAVHLPSLRCVRGVVHVFSQGQVGTGPPVTSVSLPLLEKADHVEIGFVRFGQGPPGNIALQQVNLPSLRFMNGDFVVEGNPVLTSVHAPLLEARLNRLAFDNNPVLQQITIGPAFVVELSISRSPLTQLNGLASGMTLRTFRSSMNPGLCLSAISAFMARTSFSFGDVVHDAGC